MLGIPALTRRVSAPGRRGRTRGPCAACRSSRRRDRGAGADGGARSLGRRYDEAVSFVHRRGFPGKARSSGQLRSTDVQVNSPARACERRRPQALSALSSSAVAALVGSGDDADLVEQLLQHRRPAERFLAHGGDALSRSPAPVGQPPARSSSVARTDASASAQRAIELLDRLRRSSPPSSRSAIAPPSLRRVLRVSVDASLQHKSGSRAPSSVSG
jgi:hypothetical protein